MGCHFLLQGVFPIQGLNPHLLLGRWILPTEPPGISTVKCTPGFINVLGRAAGAGCSGEQDASHPFFQGAPALGTGVRGPGHSQSIQEKQVSVCPWRADFQQSGHPGYKGRIEDGTHPGKGLTLKLCCQRLASGQKVMLSCE